MEKPSPQRSYSFARRRKKASLPHYFSDPIFPTKKPMPFTRPVQFRALLSTAVSLIKWETRGGKSEKLGNFRRRSCEGGMRPSAVSAFFAAKSNRNWPRRAQREFERAALLPFGSALFKIRFMLREQPRMNANARE
jgi:hypothetical protein